MQTPSNIIEILSPHRKVVLPRPGMTQKEIVVRELSWLAQRQLLERIMGQIAGLGTLQSGNGFNDLSTALKLVIESENLAEEVITATTSLTKAEVEQLTISEVMGILDIALELNVSSLAGGGKKIYSRIGNFGNNAAATTIPTSAYSAP